MQEQISGVQEFYALNFCMESRPLKHKAILAHTEGKKLTINYMHLGQVPKLCSYGFVL